MKYPWPGNVRELRNALERAAILCDGGPITPVHLSLHAEPIAPLSAPSTDLQAAERRAIEKALRETDGNKAKTARRLGLTRTQLYVRLRKYDLETRATSRPAPTCVRSSAGLRVRTHERTARRAIPGAPLAGISRIASTRCRTHPRSPRNLLLALHVTGVPQCPRDCAAAVRTIGAGDDVPSSGEAGRRLVRPDSGNCSPADELAAALRACDYTAVREMMRDRHAGDAAALLTQLSPDDQVVVFRVLPRKNAAAVFEYLSQDAKELLLEGMAHEEVAAILNAMAPDDRTRFLDELPAAATRQLLALLTPEQRSVARTLLGYPEKSVGRLMTPSYIAVRDDWTVREVLDYVRTHGQDSETLNVIYVVDDAGAVDR